MVTVPSPEVELRIRTTVAMLRAENKVVSKNREKIIAASVQFVQEILQGQSLQQVATMGQTTKQPPYNKN